MRYPYSYILFLLIFPTFLSGQENYVHTTKQSIPLPLILNKLKAQKGVSFLYEPETISNIKIQIPFDYHADTKTILKKILPTVHLKFKKIGRQNYIIKKAKFKNRLLSSRINQKPGQPIKIKKITLKAPPRKLSGQILDEHNLPLMGATLFLPKSAKGTNTDDNGHFELLLPPGKQTIEISFIGYETNTLEIVRQKQLNLKLKPSKNFLNEVVVNAIGFTHAKDKSGATTATIQAEAIKKSGEITLLNALGSKASNVHIARNNGDPGAATNIRIRGQNTITGASAPLIILDGIPINNATVYGGGNDITGGRTGGVVQQNRLNDLNPNDVAAVQILKGASNAALWGSRAANGVIFISTKNGQAGKLKINYQTTFAIDKVSERQPLQTVWGQGTNGLFNPKSPESWGDYIPERSGNPDEYALDGAYFEADDGTQLFPIVKKNSRAVFTEDNWNQVIQKGGFSQHNLSLSGGNKRATFYFNLGRLDQNGIVKKANYDRTNLRLNGQIYLTDWLSLSTNASYSYSSSNRIQQSSSTTSLLLGLLRTPPDFNNQHYRGTFHDGLGGMFPNRHRSYRRNLGQQQNPIYNNPSWTVFEQTALSTVHRSIISTDVKINPTKWMQFTVRAGFDKAMDTRTYFFPIGSAGFRSPGVYAEDLIDQQELNLDVIGKAKFRFNKDIKSTATLGWNINDRQRGIHVKELTGFPAKFINEVSALETLKILAGVQFC